MKRVMFVSVILCLCVPAIAAADEAVADRLHCAAGEVQVCTKPTANASEFLVMFDEKARPLYDCSVATDRGVDLRCVAETEVCTQAHVACDSLGNDWHWSERRCRCWQRVGQQPASSGSGNGSGGGNTNVSVTVQTCDAHVFAELEAEMNRLESADIQAEGLHPLQLRAAAVYARLIECNDGSGRASALIVRASRLISNFEADPNPDYRDQIDGGFNLVHADLVALSHRPITVNIPPEENWCTDTDAGRFVCIALPIIAGLAAIAGGVLLYDYFDDGSWDTNVRWSH
jgi:hypothetical protein